MAHSLTPGGNRTEPRFSDWQYDGFQGNGRRTGTPRPRRDQQGREPLCRSPRCRHAQDEHGWNHALTRGEN